jgi:hypothetical protein
MFSTDGLVSRGTTNIDFTAWLWGALNELRSSRETWLRIGAEGFEVKTQGAGGRFEQKVELPDHWGRGFLQVTGAMAMPGTRVTVRPADLLAAIRFLRYTKAKLSPRALRYEFTPGGHGPKSTVRNHLARVRTSLPARPRHFRRRIARFPAPRTIRAAHRRVKILRAR